LHFKAFFDDTGTHDTAVVSALAGYVASVDDWEAFKVDWNAFLMRHGLDRDPGCYHSADCCCKYGAQNFAGLPEQDRRQIHREAVEVIVAHPLVPIGLAITTQPYLRSIRHEKPVHKSEYIYCFKKLLPLLAKHMFTRPEGSSVAITLEKTKKVIGKVTSAYESAMSAQHAETQALFTSTPTMEPKKGWPQLQAADVLAYELGLDLKWNWNPARSYPRRGSCNQLLKHCSRTKGLLVLLEVGERGVRRDPNWFKPVEKGSP